MIKPVEDIQGQLRIWFRRYFERYFTKKPQQPSIVIKRLIRMLMEDENYQKYIRKLINQKVEEFRHSNDVLLNDDEENKIIKRRIYKELSRLIKQQYTSFICQTEAIEISSEDEKEPNANEGYAVNKELNKSIPLQQNKQLLQSQKSNPEYKQIIGKFPEELQNTCANKDQKYQFQETCQFGHFAFGDKIKNILDVVWNEKLEEHELPILVEWQPRKSGYLPKTSIALVADAKQFDPKTTMRLLGQKLTSFSFSSTQKKIPLKKNRRHK